MKTLYLISALMILLTSCQEKTADTNTTAEKSNPSTATAAAEQVLQGEFRGKVPCADCKETNIQLILSSAHKFQLTEVYDGKKNTNLFSEIGTWDYSSDKKNIALSTFGDSIAPAKKIREYSIIDASTIMIPNTETVDSLRQKYYLSKSH